MVIVITLYLCAKRTTYSTMTRYMSTKLMYGQELIHLIEYSIIVSLSIVLWVDEMCKEDILAMTTYNSRRLEDMETMVE